MARAKGTKLTPEQRKKCAPKRNRSHPDDPAFERTRETIQSNKIVTRLRGFILGEEDSFGNAIDMSTQQVNAANILLRKSLPDLSSQEVTGKDGGPVIPILTITEKE